MRLLLGVDLPDGADAPLCWPRSSEVGPAVGLTQERIRQYASKAAERWLELPALAEVRNEIVALLDANGEVMSAVELAEELIAAHGSYTLEPGRTAQAVGVVRAAVEAELACGGDARVDLKRYGRSVLVGREPEDPTATHTADDLLAYAVGLARAAQRLAAADPLPTPARSLQRLRQLIPPSAMPALSGARLLHLAAAAAGDVAVNAQLQLYPVGLASETAIRLAAGSLAVARERSLTLEEIHKRVRARFPRAADLPGRPALDRQLAAAGVALEWSGDRYAPPAVASSDVFASATRPTGGPPGPVLPAGPEVVDEVDARLAALAERNGFLAVLVKPAHLGEARQALLARLDLVEVDVTRILVETLREIGVPWELVLESDAHEPAHPDRRNLDSAVRHAVVPKLAAAAEAARPLLFTEAAPLARYSCMDFLARLADNAVPRPAARLVLVPSTGKRVLDDQALPVTDSQWMWLPEAWWQAAPTQLGRVGS